MSLLVIGLSHHQASVELRERFAVTDYQLPAVLTEIRQKTDVEEMVLLSTCNRVEIYVAHDRPDENLIDSLKRHFAANRQSQAEATAEFYALSGRPGIRHLFRVASGLESMILGETEILGQLKQSYQVALQHRHTGRRLNRIFQTAFRAAKQVRTKTDIQRGPCSVAAAAVELAERIFDNLQDHRVMVLGAGDTSEKTARALLSRGVKSIIVSNRTYTRAQELADELQGRAVRFDDWADEFSRIDMVVSSTASPGYFLNRERFVELLAHRPSRPLLLIDIAVPRDIDPTVGYLENIYLYNIDDLKAIADYHRNRRKQEETQCDAIIESMIDKLLLDLSSRGGAGADSSPRS